MPGTNPNLILYGRVLDTDYDRTCLVRPVEGGRIVKLIMVPEWIGVEDMVPYTLSTQSDDLARKLDRGKFYNKMDKPGSSIVLAGHCPAKWYERERPGNHPDGVFIALAGFGDLSRMANECFVNCFEADRSSDLNYISEFGDLLSGIGFRACKHVDHKVLNHLAGNLAPYGKGFGHMRGEHFFTEVAEIPIDEERMHNLPSPLTMKGIVLPFMEKRFKDLLLLV